MGKLTFIMMICLALATIAGCGGKKSQAGNDLPKTVETEMENDSTIYGFCGDGTSMNILQLITDKGDTIEFTLQGNDTVTVVQGGMLAGDRMAVVAGKAPEGESMKQATTVINLTSLMGTWQSIDRTFSIEEGGVVSSDNREPKPYLDWKICNGKLVLTADTFSVYGLGPDSLLLENAQGIFAYKRVKK